MRKALKHITGRPVLLDIGCHVGELLLKASGQITSGVGIDPYCDSGELGTGLELIRGLFPGSLPAGARYDCITALALLEHIPNHQQQAFMSACFTVLNDAGKLILTVPDAKVDPILDLLLKLRLVKGMSLEQHYGFDAASTCRLAEAAGFRLLVHERFQLGLNNLFVFIKQ